MQTRDRGQSRVSKASSDTSLDKGQGRKVVERNTGSRKERRPRSRKDTVGVGVRETGSPLPTVGIPTSVTPGYQSDGIIGRTDVGDTISTRPSELTVPTYDRQLQIFDPDSKNAAVAIIGLGNIGSNTAILLARMGIKQLTLVDFDTVEAHNLASQSYTSLDCTRPKVEALADQLKAINPAIELTLLNAAYQGERLDAPVMIMAVDSMEIRMNIEKGMKLSGYTPYIVDGRSGGGQVEVHSQTFPAWLETLYEGADTDPCGARFIAYASGIVAGMVANTVKRHIMGQPIKSRVIFHCDTYQLLQY